MSLSEAKRVDLLNNFPKKKPGNNVGVADSIRNAAADPSSQPAEKP